MNALLHRLDVLEKEAVERKERMGILQSSKETLEDENKRISALCTNKDVSALSLYILVFMSVCFYVSVCVYVSMYSYVCLAPVFNPSICRWDVSIYLILIYNDLLLFVIPNQTQATIKILQDELLAQEAAQKEFLEMLERQKVEEAQEREKRKEQDKYMLMQERNLLLRQRQDLQAEVLFVLLSYLASEPLHSTSQYSTSQHNDYFPF